MKIKNSVKTVGAVLTGSAAAVGAYIGWVRPWHRKWGTTPEEYSRPLPGDELVPEPKLCATHAVSIRATPEQIWPWLVQLGQGRGGFYSYDWIENAMGLDIHTADHILPEHQDLKVGDQIPLAKDGFGIEVALLEKDRYMVLLGDTRKAEPGMAPPVKPGEFMATSWGFYLCDYKDGVTRLVERWKADWTPSFANTLIYKGFLEPGAFVMQRKMLLGIKERVEAVEVVGVEEAEPVQAAVE